MEQTVNTWQKGLQMDTHPMVQGNDTLSDALNATFITMNGNEIILQNDMGNRKVNRAYLPEGYVPIGIKEYGGIIYIASYNPVNNRGQIGSFPSPEEFIDIDADKNSNIDFDFSYFEYNGLNFIEETSKIYTLTDNLHIGDKFSIYIPSLGQGTANDPTSYTFGELYISKYGNSTNNKKYSIYVGVLNSQNVFVDITNSLKLESKTYYDTVSQTNRRNPQYYIRPYDKTNNDIPENYYKYKIAGPLALKIEFNAPYSSYYSIGGVKVEKDGNYYATLYVTMTMTYNGQGCSNESGNNRWIKFYRETTTDSYQEVDIDSCRIVQEPRETTNGYEVVIKNIYRDVPVTTTDYDPTTEETYTEDLRFFTEEYCFINNLEYANLTSEQIQDITNKYIEAHKKRYINYFIGVPCYFNNNYYGFITKANEQFNPYVRNLSYFGTIDYNMLSSSAFDVAVWQFKTTNDGFKLKYYFTFLEETSDNWNIIIKCTEVSDPNKIITKQLFNDPSTEANVLSFCDGIFNFYSATDGVTYGDAYYVDITYYDYEKDYEITINDYWIFYTTLFNEHYNNGIQSHDQGLIQNVVNPKVRTFTEDNNTTTVDEPSMQQALLTVSLTYKVINGTNDSDWVPNESGNQLDSFYKLVRTDDLNPVTETKTLEYSESISINQTISGNFRAIDNKYPRYLIQQITNTEPKDLNISIKNNVQPSVYMVNQQTEIPLQNGQCTISQVEIKTVDNSDSFVIKFNSTIKDTATFTVKRMKLNNGEKLILLEDGGSWNTVDNNDHDTNFLNSQITFLSANNEEYMLLNDTTSQSTILTFYGDHIVDPTYGDDGFDGENINSSQRFGKYINDYNLLKDYIDETCVRISEVAGQSGGFKQFNVENPTYDNNMSDNDNEWKIKPLSGLWKVRNFDGNNFVKYVPYTVVCDGTNTENYNSISDVIKQFIWGKGKYPEDYYFPSKSLPITEIVENNQHYSIITDNSIQYYLYGIDINNVTTTIPLETNRSSSNYTSFLLRFDNIFEINSDKIPDSKLGIFKFEVNNTDIDINLPGFSLVDFNNYLTNDFPDSKYIVAANTNNGLQVFTSLSGSSLDIGIYNKSLARIGSVFRFEYNDNNLLPYVDETMLSDNSYLNLGLLKKVESKKTIYMKTSQSDNNHGMKEDNNIMICNFMDI